MSGEKEGVEEGGDSHPFIDPEEDTFQQIKRLRGELKTYHSQNSTRLEAIEKSLRDLYWLVTTSRFVKSVGSIAQVVIDAVIWVGRWAKKVMVPALYLLAAAYFARAIWVGSDLKTAARELFNFFK